MYSASRISWNCCGIALSKELIVNIRRRFYITNFSFCISNFEPKFYQDVICHTNRQGLYRTYLFSHLPSPVLMSKSSLTPVLAISPFVRKRVNEGEGRKQKCCYAPALTMSLHGARFWTKHKFVRLDKQRPKIFQDLPTNSPHPVLPQSSELKFSLTPQ